MRPIDADALKRLVDDEWFDCQEKSSFLDEIDRTPTIDPVKRGKWIFENRTWFHQPLLKCSCCGRRQFWASFDYCPYCGASMKDGE